MTEPWIITCETCQTKLRVRSAEAIGSILACPKCQSFVHVTPPAGPSASDSAAETPAPAATDEPAAGLSSTWPVKIGLVFVGLTIFTVVGLLVAQRTSPDAVAEAVGVAEARASQPGASQRITEPPARQDQSAAARRPASADSAAVSDGPSPDADNATQGAREAADNAGSPPALPALPELPSASERESADTGRRTDAGTSTSPAIPRIGLSQLDLHFGTEPTAAANARADENPADARGKEDAEPSAETPPPAVAASSEVRMAVERLADGQAAQPPADPGEALSIRMAGLEVADPNRWSPVEFVRLISDMTGTVITFTPEAYVEFRRRSSGPFTATYRDATAGEILIDVLKQNGLAVAQHGKHLIVGPLSQSAGGPRPVRTPDELPPQGTLAVKLGRHVTFSFTQPASLSEVLRHIERTCGVTVLVDWESLSEIGLGPGAPITASAVDQPLVDVLDGLLPQLEMAWSAVGDEAIWLTAGPQGT